MLTHHMAGLGHPPPRRCQVGRLLVAAGFRASAPPWAWGKHLTLPNSVAGEEVWSHTRNLRTLPRASLGIGSACACLTGEQGRVPTASGTGRRPPPHSPSTLCPLSSSLNLQIVSQKEAGTCSTKSGEPRPPESPGPPWAVGRLPRSDSAQPSARRCSAPSNV